ncbi:hypothetical protein EOD41_04720 [Mucilaginibacter limnophilus]|uniref:Uncharacterized protein n=1 Tax=Mucilaginibacter limnophilus TaxID=1932778 RepID=A0A437MUC0_9SPHI|nr:hypothetical protein [Mucilaginibacter limnophilus]RVU01274.1 hypothetical protein EOD41_04720 [Mucilaginibacter limnophilus]
MKSQTNHDLPVLAFNAEVRKVYFKLLKEAKALLAPIEAEPLRYSLIREDKQLDNKGYIIHEFLSPLLYLRLESYSDGKLGIHYGFELMPTLGEYYYIPNTFIRSIYKHTMADATPINIEDCIRTDYVLTECSAFYEHIEEQGCKHHYFALIPYKPRAVKRKLRKVA